MHAASLPLHPAYDDLRAAWRAAEEALPHGWELQVTASPKGSRHRSAAALPPYKSGLHRITVGGFDSDPAALLRDLTRLLRESFG